MTFLWWIVHTATAGLCEQALADQWRGQLGTDLIGCLDTWVVDEELVVLDDEIRRTPGDDDLAAAIHDRARQLLQVVRSLQLRPLTAHAGPPPRPTQFVRVRFQGEPGVLVSILDESCVSPCTLEVAEGTHRLTTRDISPRQRKRVL